MPDPEELVEYQCAACDREFWVRDTELEPNQCPWCGSDDLTTD